MLKFSTANSKIRKLRKVVALSQYLTDKRKIYSLDLLSGWSCPAAHLCASKVVQIGNKRRIKDGPRTQFRCFSASQEAVFPGLYDKRKQNFEVLRKFRSVRRMVEYLERYMPDNLGILRFHVGGGFFNQRYFDAAVEVARNHPNKLFYAYLKNLPVLSRHKMIDPQNGVLLPNFLLTASRGGKFDNMIESLKIREAVVVNYEHDATMEIDRDDSHAATPGGSFNLLIHGVQPKGSSASVAVSQQKR